jgi:hypothetical protein
MGLDPPEVSKNHKEVIDGLLSFISEFLGFRYQRMSKGGYGRPIRPLRRVRNGSEDEVFGV